MLIIGLTGGIGSGKSAAAARFAEQGIHIVDSDQVARDVVAVGMPAYQAICEHFGTDVLQASGALDRAALRRKVFDDEHQRLWLEDLLHPVIRDETCRQLDASTSPYTLLVSPLLLESGQVALVHRICVVDVPEPIQIERACARDQNDEEQIRAIMKAQCSRKTRRLQAHDIIDNSRDLPHLYAQVDHLHQTYLQLAEQRTQLDDALF